MKRRTFLKISLLSSGALAVGVGCGRGRVGELGPDGSWHAGLYLTIHRNGQVRIFSKNPEAGQGVKTALPMIVAEYLDIPWRSVEVKQTPLDERFGRQKISGSDATPDGWDDLRIAGAAARHVLVAAAASTWQVESMDCRTDAGTVYHKASDRQLRYEELLAAAAEQPAPKTSELDLKRRPSDFKLLGKSVPGVDNADIVTGRAQYGSDTRLDGMLYAIFEKCPTFGGRVISANLEIVRDQIGVSHAFVVEGTSDPRGLQSGVAIVADSWWAAQSARKKLRIEWNKPHSDSTEALNAMAAELLQTPGKTLRHDGNVDGAMDTAPRVISATYHYPYVAHACMEPLNCTAWYKDDGRLDLWAPTQDPLGARYLVSETLRISEKRIHIVLPRIGGGFGRRLRNDFVVEAAWIAREVGKPVQLQWSREDDFQHDFYRPAAWHDFRAGVDTNGSIVAFDHHFVTVGKDGDPSSGASLSENHYPAGMVPNFRLRQSVIDSNIPTGPWRSPGHSAYCWAYQSFFDEIAHEVAMDPLQFRLQLLSQSSGKTQMDTSRARSTLQLAAEKAEWNSRSLGANEGLGIAFHHDHRGYASHVAKVRASGSGIEVVKVTSAIDVGPIINRSGALAQVEGCIMDALTVAQREMTFSNGAADQNNFHNYDLLRIGDIPEIECYFIQSDNPPTGLGEPPIGPVTPAITNAIHSAIGSRIRKLPIRLNGIRE